MADQRRSYIDTCCFIDLVKTELGDTLTTDKQSDVWFLKKLLEANRDGEVELFTSTLTIAECRHAGQTPVSEQVQSAFRRLLMSGQYVRLVQMTPFIAEDARDLTWKHGISLKGADSIHGASALDRKCDEMLTGNGRMIRLGGSGDALSRLGLAVREGRDTVCLPEKYRQLEFGNGKPH
jgi:hypothetical protein